MRNRTLGNTQVSLPAIGLGCMGLSEFYGPPTEQRAAIRLLHEAIDLGVTSAQRVVGQQGAEERRALDGVVEVLELGGAYDRRGHRRLRHEPRERDAGGRLAAFLGDLLDRVDHVPVGGLVVEDLIQAVARGAARRARGGRTRRA